MTTSLNEGDAVSASGGEIRSHEVLYRVPRAEMSDAEYVAHMEWSYRRAEHSPGVPCRCFSLLDFMGLSADEYAQWIMHGIVPERAMRAAGRRGSRS
jgi:hypothetical protein